MTGVRTCKPPRRRWRWSCWLCPGWGHAEDGLDAMEDFQKHYALHHMTKEIE